MILVYKILHGFLEGVQMADTSRMRGHSINLRKDRSRLDLRTFTFSQRVVNMWNDLPTDVVTVSLVKAFKNKLEDYLIKSHYTIARVTAKERTILAYSFFFILVFFIYYIYLYISFIIYIYILYIYFC